MDVRVGLWRKLSAEELMLLNCGVGEDSWESLGLQGEPTNPPWRRSVLGVHWKDWCWSWNSNTLATWCEELTHLKRPLCWERLWARGERDDSGWDGWMASPTQWTWAWVNSRSWWWTGRPGLLWFMGLQGVGHDWAIELNYSVFIPAFVLQLQHFWVHVIEKLCIHLIRASWVICLCSSIVTPCILLNYYYLFEWRMAHRNVLQLIIQVSCYLDMEMHCLNSQCCLNCKYMGERRETSLEKHGAKSSSFKKIFQKF